MSTSAARPVAVVTGAGGAIGGAIVERLDRDGYAVACWDRDARTALRAAERYATAVALEVDVSSERAIADAAATTREQLGEPALLVNAAGKFCLHDLTELGVAEFDEIIAVNLRGTFLTCRAFIPGFVARGAGAIVNIASTAGLSAGSRRAAYSASKAGVLLLTRSITADYGRCGVRANAVCPGLIDTHMAEWLKSDPAAFRRWKHELPAQRIGTVQDVANVVAFLASEESAYMHGAEVVVDGGGLA